MIPRAITTLSLHLRELQVTGGDISSSQPTSRYTHQLGPFLPKCLPTFNVFRKVPIANLLTQTFRDFSCCLLVFPSPRPNLSNKFRFSMRRSPTPQLTGIRYYVITSIILRQSCGFFNSTSNSQSLANILRTIALSG